MLIRFPTALYSTALPAVATGGNVIYTISMTDPPRGSLDTTKLPTAVERRPNLGRRSVQDRSALGFRIYTTSKSSISDFGSSKKQFEAGQILEFTGEINNDLEPMQVSESTELRHDTNVLDISSLGISADDVASISTAADAKITAIQSQLNYNRSMRANLETEINENQKSINEGNKALLAVQELVKSDESFGRIAQQLIDKIAQLESERGTLITRANDFAAESQRLLDSMRVLTQLVR